MHMACMGHNKINDTNIMYANKKKLVSLVICCFVCISYSNRIYAAKWLFTPSVLLSYNYSDNITLSKDNTVGDAILQVTPAVNLSGKGNYIDLNARYDVTAIRYRENEQANDEYHSGNIDAKFRVKPNVFEVETSARLGQRSVSPTSSSIPTNNFAITQNRTNTLTYQFKPILMSRIGQHASMQADYIYSGVRYDNPAISEQHVKNESYHLAFSSINQKNIQWAVNYNETNFNLDSNTGYSYSVVDVTLGYNLTPKFKFLANGGDEDISDINSPLGNGEPYWSAGFEWRPSSKSTIEIRRGERFFGDSTTIKMSRRGNRTNFSLNYSENITSTSAIQVETNLVPGLIVISVADEVVLQEALNVILSSRTAKTNYGLSVDKRNIIFQTVSRREEYAAYTAFWNWRVTARSNLGVSLSKKDIDLITDDREERLIEKTVTYTNRLGKKTNFGLKYSRVDGESTTGLNEYVSNIYSLTLNWKH